MRRRSFIRSVGAAGALLSLPQSLLAGSGERYKILFMGGTGFIGPHMVRALTEAGHSVTLFNRGKSNPHLFPELEKIKGDRLSDDIKQVSGQQWDVIVDTSCYIPRAVDALMAAVDTEHLKQYVFISTISVYADFSQPGLHEGSELARMDEEPDSEDVSKYYGALKVRCEEQAEKHMPGRATIVRCGLIIGPGDKTDRFTWWPVRIAESDDFIAPGSGKDPMQTIDARDLADWVVHCIDQKLTGPFNTTNPAGLYTTGDVVELCRKTLNPDVRVTWVPSSFLEANEAMAGFPLWVGPGNDFSGIWMANAEKARAAGLKARPLAESIRDTYQWFSEQSQERRENLKAGMSAEKQAELLAAWTAENSTEPVAKG